MPNPEPTLAELIATLIVDRRAGSNRALVFGLCGPQGSGKTTLTRQVADRLQNRHSLSVASLSLDDLYLSRAARATLAREVHPLLATRGVPGTHDVALGMRVIRELMSASPRDITRIPGFDKASDEPTAPALWREFTGRADVVLFEGWCLGAKPQGAQDLIAPVNPLEEHEDPGAIWRSYVNDQLANPYQELFALVDVLAMLEPPGFECVTRWRLQQEHELAVTERRLGRASVASRIMTDAEVGRFVQHFERITRHMLAEMPSRVDLVVQLGEQREVLAARVRARPH